MAHLTVTDWSMVLDCLRVLTDDFRNSDVLVPYDRKDIAELYRYISREVDKKYEVGMQWNRRINIEITDSQQQKLSYFLFASDNIDRDVKPDVYKICQKITA